MNIFNVLLWINEQEGKSTINITKSNNISFNNSFIFSLSFFSITINNINKSDILLFIERMVDFEIFGIFFIWFLKDVYNSFALVMQRLKSILYVL